MTTGTPLTPAQVRAILGRLQRGVESHAVIAAELGLSRHTIHRIARVHGIANSGRQKAERLPTPPQRGDDSWIQRAACGGVVGFTELWVGEQQEFCDGCQVRVQCLEFGLAGPTPTVSWEKGKGPVHGGVGPRDLRRLRKLQRETADLRKVWAEVAS